MSTSEEDSYSVIFTSLKHPIRRRILRILSAEAETFSDLQKQFKIESSHLTYHIDSLGNLLYKTQEGKYALSSLGEAAVSMMKHVEEPPPTSSLIAFPSVQRTSILKTLTFLFVCGLAASLVFNGIFLFRISESEKSYSSLDKAYNGLDQAYTEFNRTYSALNQAYAELNKTRNQLEDTYSSLNENYQSLLSRMVSNSVYDVKTSLTYSTIQEAINAAENGTTLLVADGVYHESVVLNKTLTLVGIDRDRTVIDNAGINGDPKNSSYQLFLMPQSTSTAIDVSADNSVINGLTIRNSTIGIILDHCNGSVVSGNNLTMNVHGVILDHSNESLIGDNRLPSNYLDGIEITGSCNNTISNNVVSSTWAVDLDGRAGYGIHLSSSSGNTVTGNIMTGSGFYDIFFEEGSNNNSLSKNTIGPMYFQDSTFREDSSGNNTIFENNFMSDPAPYTPYFPYALPANSFWSFEGKGNYWPDYSGLDDGTGGRVAGDGVGDTDLPWHGVENYPLISPVNPFPILWDNEVFPVLLFTNSTVYADGGRAFGFSQAYRAFTSNAFGPANTTGYFNLTVPKALLSGPWQIYLDGIVVTSSRAKISENQDYTTIFVSYTNNGQYGHYINIIGTQVVPEYPSTPAHLLVMLLLAMPLIFLVRKKRTCENPKR
jgi:parallel beta-helix repeat protein